MSPSKSRGLHRLRLEISTMEIRVHLLPLVSAARPEHHDGLWEVKINGSVSLLPREALTEQGRKQVGTSRCFLNTSTSGKCADRERKSLWC